MKGLKALKLPRQRVPKWRRGKFGAVALILQMLLIIGFSWMLDYSETADAASMLNGYDPRKGGADQANNPINVHHGVFVDVHVMVFIGFGFLFTFLKRYGYSAVGVNMFVAAIAIQWAIMCEGFFLNMHNGYIKISIERLVDSVNFCSKIIVHKMKWMVHILFE